MEIPNIEWTAHALNVIKYECEQQKRGCKRKSSENSEYQCQQCPSAFANTSNLRQHVESLHTRSQTWPCSQCGKVSRFTLFCSLHLNFFAKIVLFSFFFVLFLKMFTSKSNLKVHLRVHTRIRPYHCKHCVYSCMHHSSIKEHLIKVHVDIQHSVNSPG
jgi:KRAB domain-containing zinc finger protein